MNIITTYNTSCNWGSVKSLKNKGLNDNEFILGASNHDSIPLKIEFENNKFIAEQIDALSKILKIPKEEINSLQGFIQARFAEPMRSKNNMFFFTEALNIQDRYKDNPYSSNDYRIKISKNYKKDYFRALENGEGFNIMDAMQKAFVAEGLDKKEPELYKKILKYQKILKSPQHKQRFLKFFVFGAILKWGAVLAIALIFKNKKKPVESASQ